MRLRRSVVNLADEQVPSDRFTGIGAPPMTQQHQRTGTVRSADVELFYRHFGAGSQPILILHGAGYYDSADWIEVAAALAVDR